MLDHLSIQCADVPVSARFYDAVLAPLGGARVMDFGEVIGFGVAPKPTFWIGPFDSDEGLRESHIAFTAATRAAVQRFSTRHVCGPNTTRITLAPSCVTSTATTSRPSVTCPSRARMKSLERCSREFIRLADDNATTELPAVSAFIDEMTLVPVRATSVGIRICP